MEGRRRAFGELDRRLSQYARRQRNASDLRSRFRSHGDRRYGDYLFLDGNSSGARLAARQLGSLGESGPKQTRRRGAATERFCSRRLRGGIALARHLADGVWAPSRLGMPAAGKNAAANVVVV